LRARGAIAVARSCASRERRARAVAAVDHGDHDHPCCLCAAACVLLPACLALLPACCCSIILAACLLLPSATVSSATSATAGEELCVEREPHAPRRAGPPGVPRGAREARGRGRQWACGRICWRTASARVARPQSTPPEHAPRSAPRSLCRTVSHHTA
jgi:hypothetical protein